MELVEALSRGGGFMYMQKMVETRGDGWVLWSEYKSCSK